MSKDIVLIVGAVKGGRASVDAYAKMPVRLILADLDGAGGRLLEADLNDRYGENKARFHSVDVTEPQSVETLMADIADKEGYLCHMVNVVGGAGPEEWRGLADCPVSQIEQTTRFNLLSHEYLLRYAKPLLAASPQKNRSIVMLGSINALGSYDLPAYSAAKAGLFGLMYGAAHEFTLQHRIRINLVLPGTMLSERTEKHPRDVDTLMNNSLLREMPGAEEIAEAVITFTHRLPHATQQSLVIDAGQTAYGPPHNMLHAY